MQKCIKYISLISLAVVLSCQKSEHTSEGISSDAGLISFSTYVETRAPIIENMGGLDFGVYGYSFSNLTSWGTAKTKGTPNVFFQQCVSGSATGASDYVYQPIEGIESGDLISGRYKKWELNKKYAFFAYFPYSVSEDYNGTYSLSEVTEMNIPYINYTLPVPDEGSTAVDPDELLDIMTAKRTDHSVSEGTVVRFAFNHRLFCIDLYGHNFDDDVKISNVTVKLEGIRYNKVCIYMDDKRTVMDENGNEVTVSSIPGKTESWDYTESFNILGAEGIILEQKDGSVPIARNKNIMLIPQDSSIEGDGLKVTISLDKTKITKTEDGEIIEVGDPIHKTVVSEPYKINFKEGTKYSLTLNIVGDSIFLIDAIASNWEDKDVNHSFE